MLGTLNVVVSRTIFSRSAVVQSPEFPLRSTIFTCSRCNSTWREGMCRKIELRWTQWINGSNYKISTTSSVWFGSSLKERSCFHKLPSEVLYNYIVTKLNSEYIVVLHPMGSKFLCPCSKNDTIINIIYVLYKYTQIYSQMQSLQYLQNTRLNSTS